MEQHVGTSGRTSAHGTACTSGRTCACGTACTSGRTCVRGTACTVLVVCALMLSYVHTSEWQNIRTILWSIGKL